MSLQMLVLQSPDVPIYNLGNWEISGTISKQEHNKETPEKLKGTIYVYTVYNQKSAAT
jgi:myosin-crossreactive antigen